MSMHMPFHVDRPERLADILDQLRASEMLTADLLNSAAAMVCGRTSAPDRSISARISALIAAAAPLDAALALIDSELPEWKLRRLTYDEGQWHCALSRQRELPEWLDQAIETSHPDCAAAILAAVVEAARLGAPAEHAHTHWVPRIAALREDRVCCDNFM